MTTGTNSLGSTIASSAGLVACRQITANHRRPYHLLVDTDGSLRKAFGVPKSLGLLPGRVTYVIDPAGIVRKLFSTQLAEDKHVQEALQTVREIAVG